MILSIEAIADNKCKDISEVAITFDGEGLDILLDRLNRLKQRVDHDHLMTPAWGGNELTEIRQSVGESVLVNHLRLVRK